MSFVAAARHNALAAALLSTRLALPSGDSPTPKPLGPAAYASLCSRLADRSLTPADLIGMDPESIGSMLDLSMDRATNLARLVGRAAQLSLVVDRLAERGIWLLDIGSAEYPKTLLNRLASAAPPVLFGSGDQTLLQRQAIAIVGSRDATSELVGVAAGIATNTVEAGLAVVSGGARGIDAAAGAAALEVGGQVVTVLADSLEARLRESSTRRAVADRNLLLLSPYGPAVEFSRGLAMGRNKLVYGLSRATVVVCSSLEKGGTWTGAIEAISKGWRVFAWTGEGAVPANRSLVERGAHPLEDLSVARLTEIARDTAPSGADTKPGEATGTSQATLFGDDEPVVETPKKRTRTKSKR